MMPSDVEIAAAATMHPIVEVAAGLGLTEADLHPYGRDKAKVDLSVLQRSRSRTGPPREPQAEHMDVVDGVVVGIG